MPNRLFRIALIFLHSLAIATVAAGKPEVPSPSIQLPITAVRCDEFNIQITEQLDPVSVVAALDPPVFNWFSGTFTGLPVDREITLGFCLNGMDALRNHADVAKWKNLHPMMTTSDPAQYHTYEWFRKDPTGRWLSGDPFKTEEERFAGTGRLPIQQALPPDVADQFLAEDGTYWSPWREVDRATTVPSLNIFRIHQRFTQPSATIAMRVPFTYRYLQQVIERLRAANLPGVFVDELGETPDKRKLQVIRVEDPAPTPHAAAHRTVLVIAREHATEHAASWMAYGALQAVLPNTPEANALRKGVTWLFILLQDPDGAAHCTYDRMTERFARASDADTPPEVFDYARYFTDYVNHGGGIDVVVSLHNVEAGEISNLACPFIDRRHQETVQAFNRQLQETVTRAGFRCDPLDRPWDIGLVNSRLFGWCVRHFGSCSLVYEVNDRYPDNRLSLQQLQQVGRLLSMRLGEWLYSAQGERLHQAAQERLREREKSRVEYFKRMHRAPEKKTRAEMLLLGY